MSAEMIPVGPARNVLAYNASKVAMLQSCLSSLDSSLGVVPGLLNEIKEGDCWRDFKFPDSPPVRWSASQFREFIQAPRPAGCDTPLYVLERALHGTDAILAFNELTRGRPGNPTGANQHTSGKCDNVTLSNPAADVIPFLVSRAGETKPDPNPKPPTGNSVSYAIRRLKNNSPELAERVIRGEMSAHAASVQAGFKDAQVTIPVVPARAAKIIVKHFGIEGTNALVAAIATLLLPPTTND